MGIISAGLRGNLLRRRMDLNLTKCVYNPQNPTRQKELVTGEYSAYRRNMRVRHFDGQAPQMGEATFHPPKVDRLAAASGGLYVSPFRPGNKYASPDADIYIYPVGGGGGGGARAKACRRCVCRAFPE